MPSFFFESSWEVQEGSGISIPSGPLCKPWSWIRNGLCGWVAVKKPLFRKGNRMKKPRYAKAWNEDQWEIVLWSKKSRFFGFNFRQYAIKRVQERWINECLWPSVKHGGGCDPVLGFISGSDVGTIVWIDGIVNAEEYRQVLTHQMFCLYPSKETENESWIVGKTLPKQQS